LSEWGLPDYTNYGYEALNGTYHPCEGIYEVNFRIAVTQGSFGIFQYIFTPSNSISSSSKKSFSVSQPKFKQLGFTNDFGKLPAPTVKNDVEIIEKGSFNIKRKGSPVNIMNAPIF